MIYGEKPVLVPEKTSFSDVLDEACAHLMDRQVKYSMRRIAEMENRLTGLERELDAFLLLQSGMLHE